MTDTPTTLALTPFEVALPQEALDDLRARLAATRFPADLPGDDWGQGTPVSWLRSMVERWQAFDWRPVEARLNAFPQFRAEVDGQVVHFVHARSRHEGATPLVLTHTYPGSVLDFLDVIGPLTDPEAHGGRAEDAFHVVAPSVPGTGFSTPLSDDGWSAGRVARAWDVLMRGLGYDAYGAHGSDVGANVSRELAMLAPPGFLGAHVLQLFSFPSGDPAEFERMTPADHEGLAFAGWFQTVNGYASMNASRPRTIAAALSDSPIGQLAYNELFQDFGRGTSLVTEDQALAQATLQWVTNTSAGAVRVHWAGRDDEPKVNDGPIGVAVFAGDFRTMRPFAERDNTAIVSWTEHPRGGHYAAMEVPDELVGAIRGFFRR
jgi:pimeloyl-ACP methyl ester carboxylesterase